MWRRWDEKAFLENQKRDQRKIEKAHENGVYLLEVRPDYNFDEIIERIEEYLK